MLSNFKKKVQSAYLKFCIPYKQQNQSFPKATKYHHMNPSGRKKTIAIAHGFYQRFASFFNFKQVCTCLFIILIFSQLGGVVYAFPPIPKNVHRIVFLGNSITYSGQYITDIETYFLIHYPKRSIEFINVGLPSETVSGLSEPGHADGEFPRPDLHERLQRVLELTKPDLVFACYGMNDGIYMPFDQVRFQQFKLGIQWLHEQVVKTGAKVVHLTPPVFDELKGKKPGYAAVLEQYSHWLLEQRKTAKWEVADIHGPMGKYLAEQRKIDPTFALAEDGVHPNDLGHWIMAKQILLYLGEQDVAVVGDVKAALAANAHAKQVLNLVDERQNIMKDAWLSATGHTRPGMKVGLPLEEAKANAAEIEKQIRSIVR